MDSASIGSLRQTDFVFVAFRALLSLLHAADPRTLRFKVVTVIFFGLFLALFLAVDRVSLSSYRWAELYFLLVYLAAAVLGTVFRFYELVLAPTTVGRRLRVAVRPLERLWVHSVLAFVAAALQILNYRTAAVDVTFGSHRLFHFLGVTTSATGGYEMFGATLFTYCGLVLLLKIGLIYIRFERVFKRTLPHPQERVEAMKTLLSMDLVALTGILLFALYLLSWRTGGFARVVKVNSSFFWDVVLLFMVAFFGGAFSTQSRHLVTALYQRALAAQFKPRERDNDAPWLVRHAASLMFLLGYSIFYALIGLVIVLVVVAYTAPHAVQKIVSYSNPLFSAFLGSPLAILAVYLITSRFDRTIARVADDYRRLQRER